MPQKPEKGRFRNRATKARRGRHFRPADGWLTGSLGSGFHRRLRVRGRKARQSLKVRPSEPMHP